MAPLSKIISAAALLAALAIAVPTPGNDVRQLAGEGAAANSALTSTDNGVGYGTENAENNVANNIKSANIGGLTNGGGSLPSLPGGVRRRQGDKIANGAAAILGAAGQNAAANIVKTNGDSIDGTLTSGAANAGAQVGNTEETTLENAGSQVP